MAVNRDPILKRCRALDLSPAVLGYDKKSNRNPNGNKRKKESEYASQLKEKQKLKFIYGVLEKQFYHYYELATKEEGIAGENLLKLLEVPDSTTLFSEWAWLAQDAKLVSSFLTVISV